MAPDAPSNVEHRAPPDDPAMRQAAKENPGGWVYEIDWTYNARSRTPPEAIRGGWRVDANGTLTHDYSPNPRYRAVERMTRKPAPYMAAAARALHDEWMAEIAPEAEHLFPDIPEDQKVGFWYVDKTGVLTDLFRANSKFNPPGKDKD